MPINHNEPLIDTVGHHHTYMPFSPFLQDFPKVSQSYYGLLEVFTQDHMDFISTLEPEVRMKIGSTLYYYWLDLVTIVSFGLHCHLTKLIYEP